MNHLFTGCDLPCTPLHVAPLTTPPPTTTHAVWLTPTRIPSLSLRWTISLLAVICHWSPHHARPHHVPPSPRHACCLTHPDEETKFVIEMNHLFTRCDLFGFGGTHEPVDVPAEKRGKYTIKALPVHTWFNVKLKLLLNIPIDLLMDFI